MKRIYYLLPLLIVVLGVWSGLLYYNSHKITYDGINEGVSDTVTNKAKTTNITNGTVVDSGRKVTEATSVVVAESKSIIEKVGDVFNNTVGEIKDAVIKPNVLWNVSFASQAPLLNWDALHEEACEEASMIMVDHYYDKTALDNQIMENEIQASVAWQTKNGFKVDLTAAETKIVLKKLYNLDSDVVVKPTVEQIQKALTGERLVIVPAAGRQLGNPYFSGLGPRYHMFIIIGYDDAQKEFIVNDPGTKRGEKYRYSYDVLMNANHDWNNGDPEEGAKVMVFATP